jgi:putative Holliday junction resolvase
MSAVDMGNTSSADARAAALAAAMTLMAIDLGLKRTGIAVGNRITETAEPLTTLQAGDKASRLVQVTALVRQWQPQALIVGRPCHPDGNAHDMTRSAEKFARQLAQALKLPVAMVDERYTSTEAESLGAADVDSMAACLILERYFSAQYPVIFP